ncbi:MAG TPA: type II toxin-antitoxin system RelE/ParE family toxin, partial [Candidatus Paceibacterota bacterium]|nr:type II toxin-antitoxin system RelE/ParE family toxin [Candidatus Paceibacterota bacterium]
MEIYFFNSRTRKFYDKLERSLSVNVEKSLELLRQRSHSLDMPYSRALGRGLFELRVIDSVHIR